MTKILLAEDDNDMRQFLTRALKNAGYDVVSYDNGRSAYERLREEPFALLLSDIVMPEMDGPTLLKHVRQTMPHLKVIFVSGYAEESVRRDIEDDQSVEFLPKPYSLDQINTKVKEVLQMVDASDLN